MSASFPARLGEYPQLGELVASKWNTTVATLRLAVSSKSFWRTAIIILGFILLFTVFNPAHHLIGHHDPGRGWIPSKKPSQFQWPHEDVDWSQFAYCQYVTNLDYLCNSVMAFESLERLGAKADRLMMYPAEWKVDMDTPQGKLLTKARDEYGAKLSPIKVEHHDGELTWADSFTKLLAFNQTQYKRVLSLDSDSTILQPMDELFLLPSAPVAMPRAYWLKEPSYLSSQLVLVEPSALEFLRIQEAFNNRQSTDYDMEIVNNLYGRQCIIIPHRRYDLITGEFRGTNHSNYLGSDLEHWDANKILAETKFVHFSDWPLPKPWVTITEQQLVDRQPKCLDMEGGEQDCTDRQVWRRLYADFKERREQVCPKPPPPPPAVTPRPM